MKKFLFLLTAVSFLFFSCGTTKTDASETDLIPEVPELDASVEAILSDENTDSELDIDLDNQEETPETENTLTSENDSSTESSTEEINDSYPELEDIEEPGITDISIEEIIKAEEEAKTLEQELLKQQEENKPEEEPVLIEEELSPIQDNETDTSVNPSDISTSDTDNFSEDESLQETESQDSSEEQNESSEENADIDLEDEEIEEIVIIPSRSVTMNKGETLAVEYPGSGWIYMGSTSEYNNLTSRGRKLGSADTKYTLQAKEAGTQIHHFYKVDNLTGEYIDDYLEVIVLDKKGTSNTVITAPAYKEIVPEKPAEPAKAANKKNEPAQNETTDSENNKTVSEKTAAKTSSSSTADTSKTTKTSDEDINSITPKATSTNKKSEPQIQTSDEDDAVEFLDDSDSDEVEYIEEIDEPAVDLEGLLETAKADFSLKNYSNAFDALTKYINNSSDNRDEALYLLGQLYESDGPLKNIKEAINTYETLCDNYPASNYWDKANKRIIYLKRFYINIH